MHTPASVEPRASSRWQIRSFQYYTPHTRRPIGGVWGLMETHHGVGRVAWAARQTEAEKLIKLTKLFMKDLPTTLRHIPPPPPPSDGSPSLRFPFHSEVKRKAHTGRKVGPFSSPSLDEVARTRLGIPLEGESRGGPEKGLRSTPSRAEISLPPQNERLRFEEHAGACSP